MNEKIKGSLLVVAAALIWGTVGTATRFAGNVDAINIGVYRTFFAVVATFIIILSSKKISEIIPKKKIPYLVLLGIFIALLVAFLAMSIKVSTIANAILLFYTAPIFATFFSRIFLKENIKRESFISLILCIVGIVFISGNGFDANLWLGIVFGLIAGVSYAAQMTIGRYLKEYPCLLTTFWMNLIALLLLLPFANPFSVQFDKMPILIYMGIALSAVAPFLFFEGVRYIKTQDAGVITMLDPLTNIILGILIFSEIPSLLTSLGGTLILSAVLLQIFSSSVSKLFRKI